LEDSQVNIILFGLPGAGKGTQGNILAKVFNLYKISTGDLLRDEINKKGALINKIKTIIDKGLLVSDDIINNLVENVLSNKSYYNRLIFDGYPRTMNQAEHLDVLVKKYNQKISYVFNLKVNKDSIIKRFLGRQVCSKCGLIFNEFYYPSTNEKHLCDPKFLQKRSDDNEKTVRKRFDMYTKETSPILNYYRDQNLLHEVDALIDISLISKEIRRIIYSLET
jgi:adenylate kinase